jgi:hypothetical protein
MPSSTSSSDITYREIPDRNWSLALLICLPLLIVAMVAWESFARSMQHVPGTYTDGFDAMWADERRRLDEPGNDIRLVLIGSSRILWAADLDIMEEGFGTRPLQLAIPGTGPALILQGIVEDTDFDGLVLVGVTPFLFNRLDEGFFGGAALKWYEGEAPSKRSGNAIHGILEDYFGFLDNGFALFDLIDHYSQLSDREGAIALNEEDWKLGNIYADRQTDMWPPVEVVDSFDNKQITGFWMGGLRRPPEEPEKMAELAASAIEFFAPLVKKMRERGGDVMFIRMPGSGLYLEHDLKTNHRELLWQPMVEGFDAPHINTMDFPELSSELEIPEWSHLSRKSQDDFSRMIVPFIETHYAQFRGQTIYETMGIEAPVR